MPCLAPVTLCRREIDPRDESRLGRTITRLALTPAKLGAFPIQCPADKRALPREHYSRHSC
jgi:hypothetical protein